MSNQSLQRTVGLRALRAQQARGGVLPFLYPSCTQNLSRNYHSKYDDDVPPEPRPTKGKRQEHGFNARDVTAKKDRHIMDNGAKESSALYKPLRKAIKDDAIRQSLFEPADVYGRVASTKGKWVHIFGNEVKRPSDSQDAVKAKVAANETTITQNERETFQRIFSSILTKRASAAPAIPFTASGDDVTVGYVDEEPGVEGIPGSVSTSEALESAPEVAHYPPALRAMAALAMAKRKAKMGIQKLTAEEKEHQEKVTGISHMLHEATTDHDIQNILETHVFPMLRMDDSSNLGERIALIGTSYSDLLTKALFLLRTRFEDFDGVLWVFERAKSLGPESYVVGCSADVYGEVIRSKWVGYKDIGGVVDLCHEMQANGVEATEEFLTKIEETLREFKRYEQGAHGQAARLSICNDDVVAAQQLESILDGWRSKWTEKWGEATASRTSIGGLGFSSPSSSATAW